MKVFALAIVQTGSPAKLLAVEHELSSFSYFQRGSVQEAMNFFVQTVVERTSAGTRQTVQQDNYTGHVYARHDGLASAIVTDAEYPPRVAFSILNRLLDEFVQKFPAHKRSAISPATTAQAYPELRDHLNKSQDPQSADPFMRVQRELDETKIVLHKTMESLLQRGEKLDDLVARSDQLSAQSKMFYKTAKSTNACCTYM
ncbi:palmitoyltransferase [Polyrhizophydium stewartii]|uniref:Palmitoyltransferase n=1 Tax=Polyrhizophydium stewartii TaxID=2732419 RepID=A0ABR4MZE1_9FUNG|nr:palmitoyltransferase [Polyrhizophydium stewartii]